LNHPTEDDLARFAFDPESFENRDEIAKHVAACAECSSLMNLIRTVDAGLADEEAWQLSEATRSLGTLDQTLHDLVRRVADEDDEAERLLKPLLRQPDALEKMNLAEKPKYRTGGIVRHLIAAARDSMQREPREALMCANTAVEVAETLTDDAYPARAVFDLRGSAWTQRANALRLLGRYDDAIAALDRATEAFRNAPQVPLGMATVKYVRAIIHFEREELEPAYALLEESAAEFRHLGDVDRLMRARHVQANVRFQQGNIVAARAMYEEVLRYGEAERDLTWIARESNTLGRCSLELGDHGAARRYFEAAVDGFRRLGLATEVTRAEWGLALLALAENRPMDAVTQLHELQRRFTEQGLLIDAALVALDSMEGSYALGETRKIATLASQLTSTFTSAGLMTSALTAFAYLREAVADGAISPSVIDHVRKFIRRIEREPLLLFAPPPPPPGPTPTR
jgi:tetratricopeptide (TPR) repeat protein